MQAGITARGLQKPRTWHPCVQYHCSSDAAFQACCWRLQGRWRRRGTAVHSKSRNNRNNRSPNNRSPAAKQIVRAEKEALPTTTNRKSIVGLTQDIAAILGGKSTTVQTDTHQECTALQDTMACTSQLYTRRNTSTPLYLIPHPQPVTYPLVPDVVPGESQLDEGCVEHEALCQRSRARRLNIILCQVKHFQRLCFRNTARQQ